MNKKFLYISLLIFFTGAIVFFAIFFYNRYRLAKKININNIDTTANINNDVVVNGNSVDVVGNNEEIKLNDLPSKPEVIPEWYKTDKDGDGLTDEEEDKLGTNKFESDSDFDGISDKTEIEEYKTNPMNVDTDGDGYRDGVEIMSGYDPLKK